MKKAVLIGPIHQLLTMQDMPLRGSLKDEQLPVLNDRGILVKDGLIEAIDRYDLLLRKTDLSVIEHTPLKERAVALPGFTDAHTHICYAGSRAKD